ncbi:uncharacterized protein LOC121736113 [Aricia agestis]|uniref:uncharacterized protein LOC121736113 n=1 Tax=Aricia agestis TaxID=91739 RepID=UPI001C202B52|nr:uncharacterized protein LOC121736113 [Aricia agestis]
MSIIPEEYLQGILKHVVSNLGVKDYSYETKKLENIAQNYFGILIPVELKCKSSSEDEVQIVLKLAPMDERYRVSGAVTAMFRREIFIYSEVLSVYKEMQEKMQMSQQYEIPRLYHICSEYCKEVIVMENMCVKGYQPYLDRFLDLPHIVVAIKQLARFHALSMALEDKHKKLYDKIKEICVPLSEKSNKRYMDIMIDRLKKAKVKFVNTSYVPQLDVLIENCATFVENASYAVKYTCLCHGDIWKENIMFKDQNGAPTLACLIDYQTTRMCSPAFDLLYLIVSSTDTELRRTHFHDLINIYYDTLTDSLNTLSVSVKYGRTLLDEDLKVVSPACFIVANTAIWLSSGLQEEGHVRSKIQWTTEDEKRTAVNSYKNIISNLMEDLTSYGYFKLDQRL